MFLAKILSKLFILSITQDFALGFMSVAVPSINSNLKMFRRKNKKKLHCFFTYDY